MQSVSLCFGTRSFLVKAEVILEEFFLKLSIKIEYRYSIFRSSSTS